MTTEAQVTSALERLDLETQIRQLLVVHVYGSDPHQVTDQEAASNRRLYGAATPAEVISAVRPGGVVFVRHNRSDPQAFDVPTSNLRRRDQVTSLTAGLQQAARSLVGIGLLVATDHEGGPVTRLPGSHPAGGAELGAVGDLGVARRAAVSAGHELAAVGINLNLAPVADVRTNPGNPVIGDRALSADPKAASDLVQAQIAGYHDAGIAATVKHFPGHGGADVDSHERMPVVNAPRQVWSDVHLPPFVAAVRAGVDAVMTAHLSAPALDPAGTPATLSPRIVGGLLRQQMSFDGVVMTDSLWMGGVRNGRDDGEIVVAALEAGCDVLLMPVDAATAVRAIVGAVRSGRLSQETIADATRRVLRLKAQLGLLPSGR
ncbi:MAG: beta-hexosaminidase [Actinomycetota bacterium]|nr:beta-hexosaminidase [Actinomycetota bacterium]